MPSGVPDKPSPGCSGSKASDPFPHRKIGYDTRSQPEIDMTETRTLSRLLAYPVEITATQTRESADAPWSALQFEMRLAGEIQVSLGQEAARLYARFVTQTIAQMSPGADSNSVPVLIEEGSQGEGRDSVAAYRDFVDHNISAMASEVVLRDTGRFARPAPEGRAAVADQPDEDRPITLIRTAIRERREKNATPEKP